ncbi:hypothetical protein A4X20_29740 [Mycolicibacterium iranicum]|uniref:Uncharacterized protein n=1 Tax=Mycolicibacterium iranicum TaxID=912594 RepID=A0A178LH56_MYCIR|nr:hypothetical protein A4X20_29740 [Mycolicibacterium iranicum]
MLRETKLHNGGAMMVRNGVEVAMLADASEIGDSPMMRAMSSEVVDIDTLDSLVAIASYETCLD